MVLEWWCTISVGSSVTGAEKVEGVLLPENAETLASKWLSGAGRVLNYSLFRAIWWR